MANLLPEEWAAKHGIPVRTVRYWMKMGTLPFVKEKRRIQILRTVRVACIPEDTTIPE